MARLSILFRRSFRVLACSGLLFSSLIANEVGGVDSGVNQMDRVALYVDSRLGNDAASGESPDSALQSLGEAQRRLEERFAQGMHTTLRLARGSLWRESRVPDSDAPRGWRSGTSFGVPGLRIEAYGEGDLPTLSGWMLLDNRHFTQPDAERHPNLWSVVFNPPDSYLRAGHGGGRPGLLVNGDQPYRIFYPPESRFAKLRDYHRGLADVDTREDVLALVDRFPGSYYPEERTDGTVELFLHAASDPRTNNHTYEFKVGSGLFLIGGVEMEGVRMTGSHGRHGLDGYPVELRDIEVAYGSTHLVFTTEGILENVRAIPYTPKERFPAFSGLHPRQDRVTPINPTHFGETFSLFHSYNPDSNGLIYKNCFGKNAPIGFFCHNRRANRPFIAILDSHTKDVATLIRHRPYTDVLYLIGHRHGASNGTGAGTFGSGASRNFVEDSILRFANGSWNPDATHLRMRNSVVVVNSAPGLALSGRPDAPKEPVDWEIEDSILVIDYGGSRSPGRGDAVIDVPGGRIHLKNTVVAVLGLPEGVEGIPLLAQGSNAIDLLVENGIFVGVTGLPEATGFDARVLEARDFIQRQVGDSSSDLVSLWIEKLAAVPGAGYGKGEEGIYRKEAEALEEPLRRKLEARREALIQREVADR